MTFFELSEHLYNLAAPFVVVVHSYHWLKSKIELSEAKLIKSHK